jgi:hypothetical protein
MGAEILAGRDLRADGRQGSRIRLAEIRERQSSQRCKTAGDEPGSPQEVATVHAAVRLVRQGSRERTAAGLAFGSLDQHGLSLVWVDSG